MTSFSRIAALCFALWGILHIVGGTIILVGYLDSAAAAYSVYQNAEGPFSRVAGAVLGYFAFIIVCLGVVVCLVAVRLNLKNDARGLMTNTLIVCLTELGLLVFLVAPGFVGWLEASVGLGLCAVALVCGAIACNRAASVPPAAIAP